MIPAKSLVVKCPYCSGKKELLQIVSGNTFGAQLWSDTKQIAPMLPQVSPVQKCPKCGHYYLLSRISERSEGESYSFETGWLSFDEAIEANNEIESLTTDELSTMFIITIWAYNDIIRKENEPTSTQHKAFVLFVKKVLDEHNLFVDNVLFCAELYREIGMYDTCISALNNFQSDNDFVKKIAEKILAMAKKKQDKVFQIQEDPT